MDLRRILDIYTLIKNTIPKTYPRPKLAIFEDEDHLALTFNMKEDDEKLFAIFDPESDSINLPIKNTLSLSDVDIAKVLLHELSHAYAGKKHGYSSKEYSDEVECDKFACRWVNKIKDKLAHGNKNFCGWRDEEVKYLKDHYPFENKDKLMSDLGRSWPAIKKMASSINVKRAGNKSWCNHNFFSPPYTKENMWVAGLIIAKSNAIKEDGLKIKTRATAKDILEKIKTAICCTDEIKNITLKGKEYAQLSITSAKLVKNLVKYFGEDTINNEIFNNDITVDFIRGYIEGKGSIYFEGSSAASIRLKIGGNLQTLKNIAEIIATKCNIENPKIIKESGKYYLKYGGSQKIKKIRDFLYADALLFSEEKKKVFFDERLEIPSAKCSPVIKVDIKTGIRERFGSIKEAAKLGFTSSGIIDACNKRIKTHRGFAWEYEK